MSISTHLTPDPERRLLILRESMHEAVVWVEKKTGAITVFAAGQLAWLYTAATAGPLYMAAMAALAASLPLGVYAFSPLIGKPGPSKGPHRSDDSFIAAEDLAKYTHAEMVLLLDRYFGGGITATRYYEDIVAQIIANARAAVRKTLLFRTTCLLVGIAQLCLLLRVFW